MAAQDNLNPAQFYKGPDEDSSTHCPECGAHSGGHVRQNGHILMHRGVAEVGGASSPANNWASPKVPGKPYKHADELAGDEDIKEGYGPWWGSKQLGEFYGNGGKNEGTTISAWFPENKVRNGRAEHEGHIVAEGAVGHVHEVRVRDNNTWRTLPHTPGMTVGP